MDSAKRLVVNIATWNSARFLPNLFASLDAQTSRAFSVTVVDNASSDGTLAWLETRVATDAAQGERQERESETETEEQPPAMVNRAPVGILRNFRNQGFSRAHNQAIALALTRWEGEDLEQRYVMVANPDLEFAPNAIEQIIAFMDAHPDVASCAPKLLRAVVASPAEDGLSEIQHTRTIDAFGIAITKARRAVDRGAGEEDRGQYDTDTHLFGPSGACAIYRVSALRQVRLGTEWFDEQFFAYQEDVDLAWRFRLLGLESRLVPTAVVWHHRRAQAETTNNWFAAWRRRAARSSYVNFFSTRNHGWLILKNDTFVNLLLHAPWWLPYEVAKFLAGLISPTQFRAQLASLSGMPAVLRKRKELMKQAKVTPVEMRKWFV